MPITEDEVGTYPGGGKGSLIFVRNVKDDDPMDGLNGYRSIIADGGRD
jgi:hypothetical protein